MEMVFSPGLRVRSDVVTKPSGTFPLSKTWAFIVPITSPNGDGLVTVAVMAMTTPQLARSGQLASSAGTSPDIS